MDVLWSNKSEKCSEFYSLIKHINLFKALRSTVVNCLSNLLIQHFPNPFDHRTLLNPGWHPTETVLYGTPLGNCWFPRMLKQRHPPSTRSRIFVPLFFFCPLVPSTVDSLFVEIYHMLEILNSPRSLPQIPNQSQPFLSLSSQSTCAWQA